MKGREKQKESKNKDKKNKKKRSIVEKFCSGLLMDCSKSRNVQIDPSSDDDTDVIHTLDDEI